MHAAYDAINRDDVEAFVALCRPDVEFNSLIAEVESPRYVGHDGIRRWWDDVVGPLPHRGRGARRALMARSRVRRSVVVAAALACLASAATAGARVAPGPGGSNFSWFRVDRPEPGVCIREPYGVIPNFHHPEARAQIRSELAQMFESGQRRLRIGIFHGHGFDTGTVMDATGGHLPPQYTKNLADLLAAIKAAGFVQVEIAFHPEGPGVHEWTSWDESRFEENWQLIRNLRPVIRAARLPYRIDLSNEAIPGPGQPLVLEYSRRLWRNYIRAYGRGDTVGFSVIGDPAHVGRMREVYGDTPPRVFDIHFYGGTSGMTEYELFRSSDRAMKGLRLSQPWIVGESFYDDSAAASQLRSALLATRRPVYYLTQWPLTRGSPCADVDVGAPTAFGAYVGAGFGWPAGRPYRPLPAVGSRTLEVSERGRATLAVGCTGTATRCTVTLALHVRGRTLRARPASLLPPETAVLRVQLPEPIRTSLRQRRRLRAVIELTAKSAGTSTARRRLVGHLAPG